jgi:membrane-bound ClpP family serine protease
MAKKQSTITSLLLLFSFTFDKLKKEMELGIRNFILEVAEPLIKKFVLAAIGAVLIVVGIIFICISMVNYLSIYVPAWMAWLCVGLVVFLGGCVLFLLSLRKK